MNRYRRVGTVYRKELVETLRDRRTLMAMVVVPIVLYPVLMVVLVEALKSEAGRQEKEQYFVCVPDAAHKDWLEGVFKREAAAREEEERAAKTAAEKVGRQADDASAAFRTRLGAEQITIQVVPEEHLWDQVSQNKYHAAVLLDPPPDPSDFADGRNRVVQILYNDTNPLSDVMYRQLNLVLGNEMERIIRARVRGVSGNEDLLTPLVASNVSTTSPDRQFAKALAMIVPFLLVTMTVTGAMYPAIDLTAGERERGTLETLAVSPVPVGQIVAGKFGVIVTIAMATTALNLASMTAVIHFSGMDKLFTASKPDAASVELGTEALIVTKGAEDGTGLSGLQRENLDRRRQIEAQAAKSVGFIASAAPIVLVSMIPFAVFFSAVMLAVCSFARTFKEAQNYMMPVMMAAIVPSMIVSYMPTIKLEGALLVIPVANVVVLMRELFLGNYTVSAISLCLGSTCFYAAAAVVVANKVYGNESVLFSDVGSYKTLLLRRFMRPQRLPSAALALLTVALLFPFYFYAQSGLMRPNAPDHNLVVIVLSQVLLFAVPVIFLTWYTKTDLAETFSIKVPSIWHALGALLLAVSITPVAFLLQRLQFQIFPASETIRVLQEQQAALFGEAPWWVLVLVFAVTPGICEEVLFRGFLLGGLRERMGVLKTVVTVGLVFGLFHYQLEKIPVVSFMGMVLTLVCLRSGCIFLSVIVHIANNGLAVASERFKAIEVFYDLPKDAAELGAMHFDLRTGMFLLVFVAGLILFVPKRLMPARNEPAKS
ncbi:MAG: CPBP family intramembrane metalloprotease [Planctomycetes bacterium]|nr:CPBP family intramembrane metalloprotease [Planctomycetota bacterium]